MRDADVRHALLRDLDAQFRGDPDTRIVQEMGIWAGSVRIDVAVINGRLHGYELKSAKDTLERLDDQAALYNQVFDNVTLVTADKHYYKALKKVPKWWGISIAVPRKDGTISIRVSRKPRANKAVVPLQVARLLWKTELLEILERHQLVRGVRSGTSEAMASRLAERLQPSILREEVRRAIKARVGWLSKASDLPQAKDGDLRLCLPTGDDCQRPEAD
jgi:hypothetical protein